MALNMINRLNVINKTNSLPAINVFSRVLGAKRQSSSNGEKSTELQVSEQNLERHMQEYVIDRKTHTGQTFAKDDFRLARFVGKQKEINPRFAIDLIAEVAPTAVAGRWVSCDGGGGALGHPKVFINLDDPGDYGTCGYCGLRFYKKDEHGHHH